MKILVMGDPHGQTKSIVPKLQTAGEMGIQKVLVCGDFGLWTHRFDGQTYLDVIQDYATRNELTVYAIGGNHENWDHWEWAVNNYPQSKGWAMVRSRVALAPKAHKWVWNHKQFVGAGGAVSVDREWRIQAEKGLYVDEYGRRPAATGDRTLFWPNEQLTDADVQKIRMMGVTADYLFTHDCSNNTPWKERLKPDVDSERNRRRIDEVLRLTSPKMHFHGHMHEKYDWINFAGEKNGEAIYVQTYGMERDTDYYSWGVLDTDTDNFTWRNYGLA